MGPKTRATLCSQLLFHCSELKPKLGVGGAGSQRLLQMPGKESAMLSQEVRQPPKAQTLRTDPPMSPKDLAAFRQSSGTSAAQDQGRGPGRSNWHPGSSRASGEQPSHPSLLSPAQVGLCMSSQACALGRELPVYFGPPAAQRSGFSPTGRIELPV